MKTFITVDLWDDPFNDMTIKQKEKLEIDIKTITKQVLELMKQGLYVQFKITNLPMRIKRNY